MQIVKNRGVRKTQKPSYIPQSWPVVIIKRSPDIFIEDLANWCESKHGPSLGYNTKTKHAVWATYAHSFCPKFGLVHAIAFKNQSLKAEFILSCL